MFNGKGVVLFLAKIASLVAGVICFFAGELLWAVGFCAAFGVVMLCIQRSFGLRCITVFWVLTMIAAGICYCNGYLVFAAVLGLVFVIAPFLTDFELWS